MEAGESPALPKLNQMMSDKQNIQLDISDGLATITLRRPPYNVLDIATMVELNDALETALSGRQTGIVLLAAEGKAFCAGVDVADHTADKVEEMMRVFGAIFDKMLGTDVPLLATVQGAALGGGMELITCCDIVLASDRAKFGQPEIKLGVFPPVAAAVLPRICGISRTMDLILSGRTISADEAMSFGLVSQVWPADEFESRAAEYVKTLTGLSRPVLRMTKRAALQSSSKEVRERLAEAERLYIEELVKLEDAHEGIAAFVEKRDPKWNHA